MVRKRNKHFIVWLVAGLLILSCAPQKKQDKIVLAAVVNPNLTFVTAMSHLFPDKYDVRVVRSPMEMAALMKHAEADAVFHTFIGSNKLNAKGVAKKYRLVQPYAYNAVFLVTKKPLQNITQLKGQSIYIAYKGGSPELMFRHVAKVYGLGTDNIGKANNMKIQYSTPVAISKMFLAGKADVAVLPEFFVSQILAKSSQKVFTYSLEKWSLEKNNAKDKLKQIPVGVALFSRAAIQSGRISLKDMREDMAKTQRYIAEKTKEFSENIAKHYKEQYNISVDAKILYNAVQSKRLVFDTQPLTNQTILSLAGLFGFSEKQIQGFIAP